MKANNIYKKTKIWGKRYEKRVEKELKRIKKQKYKEELNNAHRLINIEAKKGNTSIDYWVTSKFDPWWEIAELVDLKLIEQGFSVIKDKTYPRKRTISWEEKNV